MVSYVTSPPLSILIVEDNDALRSILKQILQEEGYRVVSASRMEAAQALVECYDLEVFNVVIIDVYLEGGQDIPEGYHLYEAWIAEYPILRCLLISGSRDAATLPAVRTGAVPLLMKPFTI